MQQHSTTTLIYHINFTHVCMTWLPCVHICECCTTAKVRYEDINYTLQMGSCVNIEGTHTHTLAVLYRNAAIAHTSTCTRTCFSLSCTLCELAPEPAHTNSFVEQAWLDSSNMVNLLPH